MTADGTTLASRCEVARGVLGRGVGLMFRSQLAAGHALWLEPCRSIHTLFMRFPLDVAFLDRRGVVVKPYHGLRPWRMTRVVRGACAAVELPAGTLVGSGVAVGTIVRLHDGGARPPLDSSSVNTL